MDWWLVAVIAALFLCGRPRGASKPGIRFFLISFVLIFILYAAYALYIHVKIQGPNYPDASTTTLALDGAQQLLSFMGMLQLLAGSVFLTLLAYAAALVRSAPKGAKNNYSFETMTGLSGPRKLMLTLCLTLVVLACIAYIAATSAHFGNPFDIM